MAGPLEMETGPILTGLSLTLKMLLTGRPSLIRNHARRKF